jgi:hypothetical protein
VASVGSVAITQRDIDEEYHFESFLQGMPPEGKPDAKAQEAVLKRLIRQELLSEQMRGPAAGPADSKKMAEETLNEVHKKFASEAAYRAALQSLGMSENQVLIRLEIYQRTLRMIDQRLRPAAWPQPAEVDAYYKETFVPGFSKEHSGAPPSIDDVRDQIQEILVQKKMNELLEKWLDRLKSTHEVIIHSQ